MKIATVSSDAGSRVALLVDDRVYDLRKAAANAGRNDIAQSDTDLLGIIDEGPGAWDLLEQFSDELRVAGAPDGGEGDWWKTLDDTRFEPPIIPRKNPWVVGANYFQHMANGFDRIPLPHVPPAHVEFFCKSMTSICGSGDDITYDKRATRTVDYEAELCVVLGREGMDVPKEEAYDWVFGYTVANDISARELQLGHRQYFRGKSLDGFCPLGPVISTTKEIPDPNALRMRQWVNGELKQDWPVGDMIYPVDHLIAVVSEGLTVEPGDMIICGTVPGVGFEQLPQSWLQHDDLLEAEISRIGVLKNTIKMAGIE